MNIEEAIKILKQEPDFSLNYYNRENAIETLLTAYEKEKEKNKKLIEELKAINKMQEYRKNEMDIPKSVAEQKEKQAWIEGTNVADKLCNKKWEDKIKAKIEEIENTGIDVAWEQVNYTIREQDRAKIQVLQSLLEKE